MQAAVVGRRHEVGVLDERQERQIPIVDVRPVDASDEWPIEAEDDHMRAVVLRAWIASTNSGGNSSARRVKSRVGKVTRSRSKRCAWPPSVRTSTPPSADADLRRGGPRSGRCRRARRMRSPRASYSAGSRPAISQAQRSLVHAAPQPAHGDLVGARPELAAHTGAHMIS